MTPHLEIERKFLIEKPSEEWLLAAGARCDDIIQTYLLAEEGTTARVRARRREGKTTYTVTEKRPVTSRCAWESEREITEEEYRALLDRADPTCRPIQKRRYTLPNGGFLLEIDLYPFWQRTAVLEIELPQEDTPFSLPPEIVVLREVTEDLRYKNSSLSKSIPAE